MFKKILIGLVVVVGGFVIVVSLQPNDFGVTRSTVIAAPARAIFPHVNDLRSWEAWSPWAKLDPNAKSTFEGPTAGVGAVMRWAGNIQVGEGSMTITDSKPNERIQFRLEFLKPFKSKSVAEFSFKPEGRQTLVSWSMYGQSNFVSKGMGLFMDCDKMMGGQFEKGLAQLKGVVEASKK